MKNFIRNLQEILNNEADNIGEELDIYFSVSTNANQIIV